MFFFTWELLSVNIARVFFEIMNKGLNIQENFSFESIDSNGRKGSYDTFVEVGSKLVPTRGKEFEEFQEIFSPAMDSIKENCEMYWNEMQDSSFSFDSNDFQEWAEDVGRIVAEEFQYLIPILANIDVSQFKPKDDIPPGYDTSIWR